MRRSDPSRSGRLLALTLGLAACSASSLGAHARSGGRGDLAVASVRPTGWAGGEVTPELAGRWYQTSEALVRRYDPYAFPDAGAGRNAVVNGTETDFFNGAKSGLRKPVHSERIVLTR